MRASYMGFLCLALGTWAWETVEDAAWLSRRLVKRESIATLATVYPVDSQNPGLANHPFALMEYYADCHNNGSLTYLFFPISQNSRNVASAPSKIASFTIRAGESASSTRFVPEAPGQVGQAPLIESSRAWNQGPAASARVALMGRVSVMYNVTGRGETEADKATRHMSSCFVARHPDAKWWVPGRKGAPHVAWWARFDPEVVYYVGGFGDEHYIGHIPVDMYRNVTV